MKTCFSDAKLMKQFGNPLFLREPPPPSSFQLTPLFLSNFFMTPLFIQISETFWGGNYVQLFLFV